MLAKTRFYFFDGIKKVMDYKTTSSRSCYWYFMLGAALLISCLLILNGIVSNAYMAFYADTIFDDSASYSPVLLILNSLAFITSLCLFVANLIIKLCSISLSNRRLRDLKINTWMTLLFAVPILDLMLSLILFTKKGFYSQGS